MSGRPAEVRFSDAWFDLFLCRVPASTTAREVAFLSRRLPRAGHRRILDVCCGAGRHAAELARAGHVVVAVDRSVSALRTGGGAAGYARVAADMRTLPFRAWPFDAVICMWASFGWFDGAANRRVLDDFAGVLRPGGRLVLDVYNRSFFERYAGVREREVAGRRVIDRKWMEGDRLFTVLDYGEAGGDRFEWQVYRPDELEAVARAAGFVRLVRCSGFDEEVAPSAEQPRMQFVFEKRVNPALAGG